MAPKWETKGSQNPSKIDPKTIETSIKKSMTKKFISCEEKDFAFDVLNIMRKNKINSLPVLDDKRRIDGAINIHILIDSGIN